MEKEEKEKKHDKKKEQDAPKKGRTMTGEPSTDVDVEPTLDEDLAQELIEISMQQRIRRRARMRRLQPRLKQGRRRARSRGATRADVDRRSRRRALAQVKRKVSGGKSIFKMSPAERRRAENMAKKRAGIVKRTAQRLRQTVRTDASKRNRRRPRNEEFENFFNSLEVNTSDINETLQVIKMVEGDL